MRRISWFVAIGPAALSWTLLQAAPLDQHRPPGEKALEFVNQVGAVPLALAAQGDRAYIGIGSRLTAWDCADPSAITMVGSGPVLSEVARDIVVHGDLAFVRGDRRMLVYSLADPDQPRPIGELDLPAESHGSEYTEFEAFDTAAYYLKGSRLRVVDVRDATRPGLAGELRLNGPLAGLATHSQTAFVGYAYGLLHAIDVSRVDAPLELGQVELGPMQVRDVAADTDHAYVVGGSLPTPRATAPPTPIHSPTPTPEGWPPRPPPTPITGEAYLRVVDVREPASMALAGGLTVPQQVIVGDSVVAADDRAYVVDQENTLRVADVTDPHHPRELGAIDLGSSVRDGALVSGGFLALHEIRPWTPADPIIVQAIDLADPTSLRVAAELEWSAWLFTGLAHDSETLYGADPRTGLRIVDISDPLEPREISAFEAPGIAGVAVRSHDGIGATRGYLIDRTTLRIVDLSDGTEPRELGSLQLAAGPRSRDHLLSESFAVQADHVFALSGSSGLRIVDVADPSDPREVASLALPSEENPDHSRVVAVDGNMAYVGALWQSPVYRLHVVDVSDPAHPLHLGELTVPWDIMALTARDGFVYATSFNDERGLHIIDARDPSQLHAIASVAAEPGLEELALVGDLIYSTKSDLRIYDVSEPANPREVLVVEVPRAHLYTQYAEPLVVTDGYVYLGDTGGTGLTVLAQRSNIPTPGAVTPSATPSTTTPTPATPVAPPGDYRRYIPMASNGPAG